jgi:hypothetical protein
MEIFHDPPSTVLALKYVYSLDSVMLAAFGKLS